MNTLDWLLDPADPGPRYLALRDLVRLPADEPELLAARAAGVRRAAHELRRRTMRVLAVAFLSSAALDLAFAGAIVGLTGMGGGALMTPILILVGIPPTTAVGTL